MTNNIPECSRSCPPWEIPCMVGCPHILPKPDWKVEHGFGDLDFPAPNSHDPNKRGFDPK